MKKNLLLLFSLCMLIISCKKDEAPYFTLTNTEIMFQNTGGSESVTFETNVSWKANASESWCTVSPTNGDESVKKLTIKVIPNSDYDSRNCFVTIVAGGISKTIKVIQYQKNALIISNKIEDLTNHSQQLEVALKTNIDFEVIIPEAAKGWISYIGIDARSLQTKNALFEIAENNSGKIRMSEIYIKEKGASLQDTLTINQYEEFVYFVRKMGTLNNKLSQTQKDTITTMIVRGEINKADFEVMKKSMPRLLHVNLLDVKCEENKIPDAAFGGEAYTSKENLSTIVLPKSITSIGAQAFNNCYWLSGTLVLPDGLTSIGDYAFSACNNLRGELIIPKGLISIGEAAFNQCYNLTGSLKFPEGFTSIGKDAFNNCIGLKGTLTIPESLTTIPLRAFCACSGLSGSLTFPDGLTSIGANAFDGCSSFDSLVFGDNIETISSYAFNNCENISGDVVFPGSLSSMGRSFFWGCDKIDTFKFPHTTPLSYGNYSGYDLYLFPIDALIKVPNSAVEIYKNSEGWKNHTIVGY